MDYLFLSDSYLYGCSAMHIKNCLLKKGFGRYFLHSSKTHKQEKKPQTFVIKSVLSSDLTQLSFLHSLHSRKNYKLAKFGLFVLRIHLKKKPKYEVRM